MLALVKRGGLLRRDQRARQTHHLHQLLDGQILADKPFEIGGGQTFLRQHLIDKPVHRFGLAVATQRAQHFTGGGHNHVVADVDAQSGGLPIQQNADVSFAFPVAVGEIFRVVRPFAVMQPVKNVKGIARLHIFLRRDFAAVNRAKIACATASAVATGAGTHEDNKRNDREAGNDPPQPR